ncbi:MAG TPA: four helix bundle protein [Acidobacteriota bacterium]|nr:four helix bundle protein [Acidobacteriota bacterium]
MSKIINYKDLEIYQLAHSLAVEVHKMTLTELPKFEQYEEASQLRRSTKSIPCNIVEGFGRRRYKAEYLKFLVYSHASCDEAIEHFALLRDTLSLSANRANFFLQQYDVLGRKLSRFIQAVQFTHRSQD